MQIQRWPGSAAGRSRIVAYGGLIWTVANASDRSDAFHEQALQSLRMLEAHLIEAGSSKAHLLSIQVMLADIGELETFDNLWREWIGSRPEHRPQRACFQKALAPGLLIELAAVAASASEHRERE